MEQRHYLILSEGTYSDYSPEYFVGETEISQEKLDQKGGEVGDEVIAWFQGLPERVHTCSDWCFHYNGNVPTAEKYNPENDETVYRPDAREWMRRMKVWVLEQGYEPLPENIPEINTSYSEFPTTTTKKDSY